VRQVVIWCLATGLYPFKGHRLTEIGCVEIINNIPTKRTWHCLFDPQMRVAEGIQTQDFASARFCGAPSFAERSLDLLNFLGDAKLITHDWTFHGSFLNAELRRLDLPPIGFSRWLCLLALATRKRPRRRNELDTLCVDFNIASASLNNDSALATAQIISEVYARLTGQVQAALDLELFAGPLKTPPGIRLRRKRPLAARITAEENAAHERFIREKISNAIWLREEQPVLFKSAS
jgi:DNA polymerase III subunit epsilon